VNPTVATQLEALAEFVRGSDVEDPAQRSELLARVSFLRDSVAVRTAFIGPEERARVAEILQLALKAATDQPSLGTSLLRSLLAVLPPADPLYPQYAITLARRLAEAGSTEPSSIALYRYVLESAPRLDAVLHVRLQQIVSQNPRKPPGPNEQNA
jgi:hypothetical protein